MPCDIGYRSVSRARLPDPAPQTFESRATAPAVDAELLDRLGQDDPAFLGWLRDLEAGPLLATALERALAASTPLAFPSMQFAIRGGALAARATTRNDAERVRAEETAAAVSKRWQIEVLRMVAELLDFVVTVSRARENGRDIWVIEGEKTGSGGVREWLRITSDTAGGVQIQFEHFASAALLATEETKLLALAQKLGVPVAVVDVRRAGQAIPDGTVHRHPDAQGGTA